MIAKKKGKDLPHKYGWRLWIYYDVGLSDNLFTKKIHISASGESPQMSKNLSAPQDFSYHCSPYIIKYRLNETTNGTVNVTLILDGFQVQKKEKIYHTNMVEDCEYIMM
jgi:hypothetical protein